MAKKKCKSCNQFKTIGEFKAKRSSKCLMCDRDIRRLKRYLNTAKWISYISNLMPLKCCKCSYAESFSALDFHHLSNSDKQYTISYLMSLKFNEKNIHLMRSELSKCIVLCSNCHRTFHAMERITLQRFMIAKGEFQDRL
jgi:hypothetical protein